MGKLTLSVERSVAKRAKAYAARRGTSVSSLVERYLDLLSRGPEAAAEPVSPVLGRLRAELDGMRADETSYGRYLRRKYR
jgi:hypothetical protein